MIRWTVAILLGMCGNCQAGLVPLLPSLPLAALDAELEADATDDPAALVRRITSNARDADQRLAQGESGPPTRTAQQQVLADIDRLLNQKPPPPPPMPPPSASSPPPPSSGSDASPPPPIPKPMGSPPPPSDNEGKQSPMPMGTSSDTPKPQGRRDRGNPSRPEPMSAANNREGSGKQPVPSGNGKEPPMPANAAQGGRGGPAMPAAPADDAPVKDVWGHLPERLRQQMTQYYREQFSGPYGELLRDYYSTLSNRERGAKP